MGIRYRALVARFKLHRRWTRWRVKHGAPIPRQEPYTVVVEWTVNQIEKAFDLPLSKAGDTATGEWWDRIAVAADLPTHAQMTVIYGEGYPFPSWLLNAAIDIANSRRRVS